MYSYSDMCLRPREWELGGRQIYRWKQSWYTSAICRASYFALKRPKMTSVACGAKLRWSFSDRGGDWPSLEHRQPAAQTQRRRDVSQDNTTKHKFWNANLHVIMQNPVKRCLDNPSEQLYLNAYANITGTPTFLLRSPKHGVDHRTQERVTWWAFSRK